MKEDLIKISYKLVFWIICAIAFFTPLFFAPTTSEFFEFNKFTLILVLTSFALIIWSLRMFLEQKVAITKTPFDFPLLILLFVFLASTLSSVDQFVSLVGAHGRPWPSFLGLLTVSLLYFTAVSNIKTVKQTQIVMLALTVSTAIASVIAIFSYFGFFLPFEFAKIRSFNTLGIINRLAILESMVLTASLAQALISRDKIIRFINIAACVIILFSLVLINFWPAYLTAILGIFIISLKFFKGKFDGARQTVGIIAIFAILILVLRFVPQVAQGTLYEWIAAKDANLSVISQIDTKKEGVLSLSAAWQTASRSIGQRPILGTGPATFGTAYTKFKPRFMNQTENWAVRFDKSFSEILEIVATVGLLGICAYLLFAGTALRFMARLLFKTNYASNNILPACGAIAVYLASVFLASPTLAAAVVFFIYLALLAVIVKNTDETAVYDITLELAALKSRFSWLPQNLEVHAGSGNKKKSQILPGIAVILALGFSLITLRYQFAAYRAEYYYRQALLTARSNDGNRMIGFLQKAIAANPRIDTYHQTLAETALSAALGLSQKKDLADAEKRLLANLVSAAIEQSRIASGYGYFPLKVPGISATDVGNWETVSNVYQSLIGSTDDAQIHAVNTLSRAILLDPENPLLHDRLGILYDRLNRLDEAQRKYDDAITVKFDFGPAHYHMAKLLIGREGDTLRIVNELTLAKQFLPGDDPAMRDIEKNLETYTKQLREKQEQAIKNQKPQEDANAEGSPKPSPSVSPSPSPTPAPDENEVSASPSPSL